VPPLPAVLAMIGLSGAVAAATAAGGSVMERSSEPGLAMR
jgi:hypothetical protein